ncbi:HesB/IscA family protein [Aquirufa sp. ROCK2-A2]
MSNSLPIQFSQSAKENLQNMFYNGSFPEPFLRIGMKGGACGGTYILGFDHKTEFDEEYIVDEIPVVIDKRQLLFVIGTSIEFETRANGFYLHKPQSI